MVNRKYYPTIEGIARRLDDEKLEEKLKGLSDEEFERWFNTYLALKPVMKEHLGLRRCKDCKLYPCDDIEYLKKDWKFFVEIWYEDGSACTNFQPKVGTFVNNIRKRKVEKKGKVATY